MAEIITMPRLSDTMTEGVVAVWHKKVGDKIAEGDILADIETDKATMEFESFYEGTLLYIGIQEGDGAPVDALLAIIGDKNDDVEALLKSHHHSVAKETPAKENPNIVETPKQAVVEQATPAISKTPVAPIVAKPVQAVTSGRVFASPLAKKLAEEKGISIQNIAGSGENGRIVKSDVENFKGIATAAQNTFVASATESFEELKNSQMRKVIARRLGESKFTAPHYYLSISLDMDNAISFREQANQMPDTKISFNDLVVKAVAIALRSHKQVNSQWTENSMIINNHIHIGVAVAVEDGLVVPVIKFADQKTMSQIGIEVKELANKARSKKIQPQEMEGSTFTVSNLGMFGIEDFTSIINAPNSAILSVGAITQQAVVKNNVLAIGNVMKVTLACDHRTVDGATGAKFLQTFKHLIENPVLLLLQ
ncbi:MAG: pyruvate dehydrogenase complex dihydrolipoamide acetyltransferase [Flavobacteriales bacterium CG_4_8_14_3_um_filter_35_10]|nr:pyruvate dehydrogenase complex dihydrolipoamide acetyltransferase [Zetaproteobacteria bacterium]OIO08946.1 MAG: pyruvate dehydrogenase complex dihydrolipoamide acetyltransferase [Flavobacteriaceae bacterium CG1_02_35_72]PIX05802.1 MAG: pyruvate dehydrogenase complex dihydrolipoamide acetyltransferase [Flavobacteriales bacterium CG_4_8_14_3_um_filter_35_10]PJA05930.1 MAG: pyruvate dehydrogenase complex dihydrolipoamide acetyltransferase [Flavobacteriales bacterium CG_4_10_14_0_2_um_filter_35_1